MDLFRLIERITDPEQWPSFEGGAKLDEMEGIADDAFSRGTTDGYLAYVLITHQICDDLIRVLVAHGRFTLHLLVVPNGFGLQFSNDENDTDLVRLMTGQLLQLLEKSLEFDERDEFITLCKEMSDIRNQLAHQLARRIDFEQLQQTASKYRTKFARADELFWQADDIFRLFYKDQKKSDHWDWELKETLDSSSDEEELAECRRVVALRKEAGYYSVDA